MRDHEVDDVLDVLEGSWPGRVFGSRDQPTPARALWGAELSKYEQDDVMRVVASLLRTEKWRPPLADILARVRSGVGRQRRVLAAAEQRALPPATEGISPERVDELVAPLLRLVRPPTVERRHTAEESLDFARITKEKVLGALTLAVLRERRAAGDTEAADVLDEVARRAEGEDLRGR